MRRVYRLPHKSDGIGRPRRGLISNGIAAMKIITTIQLITINATLFVQIFSFLIFMLIINRIMFRPLRKTLAKRHDYVKNVQQEISASSQEVTNLNQQIAKRERSFSGELAKLMKSAADSGNQQAEEILTATWKEIADMHAAAHKDINARIATARKSLQQEAESLAKDIVAKFLDRRPVQ
jgi:F-type H+-transporting ATPase subunit b